ncbi:MAG: hypothetical protein V3R86_05615 [Candidatus Hydrothermarchaeaceae archaeon]
MVKCDICGAVAKETCECKACGKIFCFECGDSGDERCEFCSTEEEW